MAQERRIFQVTDHLYAEVLPDESIRWIEEIPAKRERKSYGAGDKAELAWLDRWNRRACGAWRRSPVQGQTQFVQLVRAKEGQ